MMLHEMLFPKFTYEEFKNFMIKSIKEYGKDFYGIFAFVASSRKDDVSNELFEERLQKIDYSLDVVYEMNRRIYDYCYDVSSNIKEQEHYFVLSKEAHVNYIITGTKNFLKEQGFFLREERKTCDKHEFLFVVPITTFAVYDSFFIKEDETELLHLSNYVGYKCYYTIDYYTCKQQIRKTLEYFNGLRIAELTNQVAINEIFSLSYGTAEYIEKLEDDKEFTDFFFSFNDKDNKEIK